jgi:hypothetical protein
MCSGGNQRIAVQHGIGAEEDDGLLIFVNEVGRIIRIVGDNLTDKTRAFGDAFNIHFHIKGFGFRRGMWSCKKSDEMFLSQKLEEYPAGALG